VLHRYAPKWLLWSRLWPYAAARLRPAAPKIQGGWNEVSRDHFGCCCWVGYACNSAQSDSARRSGNARNTAPFGAYGYGGSGSLISACQRGGKENRQNPFNDSGLDVDPNYKGKGLQLEFTVEDQGVFTMPWSSPMSYRRALDEWPESVCAENAQ
jgi:hypothetical protein